jgi:hypothetical protein
MRRRRRIIMILSSMSVSGPAIDSNLDQYYGHCIVKFMEKEVVWRRERKILYYSSANLKLGWWLTQINLVVRDVDQYDGKSKNITDPIVIMTAKIITKAGRSKKIRITDI